MILLLLSCTAQRRLVELQRETLSAALTMAGDEKPMEPVDVTGERDTLQVHDFEGRKVLIMKAVRDVDGSMVAHDVIDAAFVSARFRNVAERNGKVDIAFQINVPAKMQYSAWQLRFKPCMSMLGDTLMLAPVIITGNEYRKAQLRGYERYRRFIDSIVSDSTAFINADQLEIFIERNMPEIYGFKTDSSYVSEEQFASYYGVTERDAVEHYMNKFRLNNNKRRMLLKDRMFRKYVKVPIVTEGLRLDTVIQTAGGDFVYNYIQTITVLPRLRKVDVMMSGKIYEEDRCIYDIPESDALTFYISSLSTLADYREKFLTKVIERRVEENTACYIDFRQGSYTVEDGYGNNASEIGRIKSNLKSLLENREYDLDSIVVMASASPEGSEEFNIRLSARRALVICGYFDAWMQKYTDSLDLAEGVMIDEEGKVSKQKRPEIKFIAHSGGENWRMFEALMREDSCLTPAGRKIWETALRVENKDEKERLLGTMPDYNYVRQSLYPRLRTVKFDFYLHRRGMVKDTVHTTELDSVYMAGLNAIKERDYTRAVSLLRHYNDYNTAVAYMCKGYDASAAAILEQLDRDSKVNYMLAVLYGRMGDDTKAVQAYLHSCSQDKNMIHRGNLDPEIYALKKKYELGTELDRETTITH